MCWCRSGSGYDCTNGRGWGVRPYRWLAGALAALYTGTPDPPTKSPVHLINTTTNPSLD